MVNYTVLWVLGSLWTNWRPKWSCCQGYEIWKQCLQRESSNVIKVPLLTDIQTLRSYYVSGGNPEWNLTQNPKQKEKHPWQILEVIQGWALWTSQLMLLPLNWPTAFRTESPSSGLGDRIKREASRFDPWFWYDFGILTWSIIYPEYRWKPMILDLSPGNWKSCMFRPSKIIRLNGGFSGKLCLIIK